MSYTTNVTESIASFDTATEEPIQFARQPIPTGSDMMSTSPFDTIQYSASEGTHRLHPIIIPGGRRPRGRTGALNEAQRISTANMRKVKACQSCRMRKAKCDPGIPCRQCINYYKHSLIHHPCRGQSLEDIADKLLKGHIFPRKRNLGLDFGVTSRPWANSDFTVYLSLGFGQPLEWSAQVVGPVECVKYPKELRHDHIVYQWPSTERTVKKQWSFPALLTNTTELKDAVDKHLTKLIDNPENFKRFPRFGSPLVVLKHIYLFYLKLCSNREEEQARKLLGQAFKLMNLIHIGGDTLISPSQQSRDLLDLFFSPEVREEEVVPCYIRGQLGEVFSKLASEYMKEVLSKLEIECLNKNCSKFPLIICTFMVLMMSIESIQHKTHKDTFHSAQDGVLASNGSTGDDIDGMVDLLEFYKNCFAGCHRDRLLSGADIERYWTNPRSAGPSFIAGQQVLAELRNGIQQARFYLTERSKESLNTSGGDITVFFDRLVARLLLLE
jgi:hypothetical protein